MLVWGGFRKITFHDKNTSDTLLNPTKITVCEVNILISTANVFKDNSVFITDGKHCYQVNEDGTRNLILKSKIVKTLRSHKPYKLIHKIQFDFVKPFLLDKQNPVNMTKEQLDFYCLIGFISTTEYNNYLHYLCGASYELNYEGKSNE